jgi:hypothetical protein
LSAASPAIPLGVSDSKRHWARLSAMPQTLSPAAALKKPTHRRRNSGPFAIRWSPSVNKWNRSLAKRGAPTNDGQASRKGERTFIEWGCVGATIALANGAASGRGGPFERLAANALTKRSPAPWSRHDGYGRDRLHFGAPRPGEEVFFVKRHDLVAIVGARRGRRR